MKTLGFISCHYVGDFFKESILSIKDCVDKVHISYSKKPSHGFYTLLSNPDHEFEIKRIAKEILGDKLIWESTEQFLNEEDHRKQRYKYSAGYSLIFSPDLDEIYEPESLKFALIRAYELNKRFYAIDGFIHFWKGFEWCFINDGDRPTRIENLTRDNLDISWLHMLVYHTSMVQSEEIIKYKFSCFGHKNEIKEGYLDKYLSWTPDKIDEITHLHPTRDNIWIKPELFTGELPQSLKNYQKPTKQRMKILLIPMDWHRDKESPELFTDMLNAFNIENVAIIHNGDMERSIDFKPNIILYQASLSLDELACLKVETKAIIFMYTGDGTFLPPQGMINLKYIIDVFLLPFSGKNLEPYQTLLGKPCHFIWEPIQNWRFIPNKQMEDGNISFVGRYYRNLPGAKGRKEDLLFIHSHLPKNPTPLNIYGCMEMPEINYREVPNLYNKSFAVICENNYSDREDYFTPRNLGAMAAGSCALHKYFPGIEKHFQNYVHGMYYKNKYELLECINFLRANPDYRNHMADQGFKLVNENFTMIHWVQKFMEIVKTNYLK